MISRAGPVNELALRDDRRAGRVLAGAAAATEEEPADERGRENDGGAHYEQLPTFGGLGAQAIFRTLRMEPILTVLVPEVTLRCLIEKTGEALAEVTK